jgi:hypothetical protein
MFPNRILFRIPDSGAGAGYIKGYVSRITHEASTRTTNGHIIVRPCFSTCGNLILSPYYRRYVFTLGL